MAQINIILNQEEILDILSKNRDEAFKIIVQKILDQIMLAESNEILKAEPYERCEERTDFRNGFRDRELVTRIGKITTGSKSEWIKSLKMQNRASHWGAKMHRLTRTITKPMGQC